MKPWILNPDFKNNPNKKKYLLWAIAALVVLALVIVVVTSQKRRRGLSAEEIERIIAAQSPAGNTEAGKPGDR